MDADRWRPDRSARRLDEGDGSLPRDDDPPLGPPVALTNVQIADLLARASAAEEDGQRQRALRRASLAALSWPEEVADLAARGRAFTELRTVGPWIAGRISEWLERPPEVQELALEIDGAADREDLDVATVREIADVDGLWFAIDTDAHHPDELQFIDIGVATAIRGGVRRDRVINLLGPDDLDAWIRERRRRRGSP